MSDEAKVIQVIVTTLTRRGTGKDADSPIRIVTQYWSLDGELLAEVDPCPPTPLREVMRGGYDALLHRNVSDETLKQ